MKQQLGGQKPFGGQQQGGGGQKQQGGGAPIVVQVPVPMMQQSPMQQQPPMQQPMQPQMTQPTMMPQQPGVPPVQSVQQAPPGAIMGAGGQVYYAAGQGPSSQVSKEAERIDKKRQQREKAGASAGAPVRWVVQDEG